MPVNDTTTNRSYQKPNIANTLSDDVGRLRSALDAIDTDMASKAPSAGPTFTEVTTVAAGSAAAPSLTFTGATSDTGLYSPGADQLAISTGGTGRLFVDANGRVGIGTSSPNYALDVRTTGTTISSSFTSDQSEQYIALKDSGTTLGHVRLGSTSGAMLFNAGNAERLRITSDGKVGIGTSSPAAKLHVETIPVAINSSGSVLFGPNTNYGLEIRNVIDGSGFPRVELQAPLAGNGPMLFFAGGATERMRIADTGNVGIGTTSPTTKLQVGTGNPAADTTIAKFGTADANVYALALTNWTGTTTSYGPKIAFDNSTRSTWVIGGEDGGGAFIFKDVTIGNNERMRLDSSGRLLVGTSSDSGGALLQVNGDRIRVGTAKTPASATATGTTGEICWDANYIYVCTATNTWKRTAIASW